MSEYIRAAAAILIGFIVCFVVIYFGMLVASPIGAGRLV